MSVLNENTIIGASAAGGDYEIEQSLRFDDNAYLSRTPSTASNRKTWTWSGWVKLNGADNRTLFSANNPSSAGHMIRVYTNQLSILGYNGGWSYQLRTNQLFRDPSAWYHIVAAIDTTQSTASNRVKMYVNGEQVTSFSAETYPSQNFDTFVNSTNEHYLGVNNEGGLADYLDGYLAEVNFIDGLALTPDSFGETGDYGEWKPIAYDGAYGTNGFYLPFKQDYAVEGFSTVLWEGSGTDGSSQYVGGVGFSPDMTWMKTRIGGYDPVIFDQVRGHDAGYLQTDGTQAETAVHGYITPKTDGFEVVRGTDAGALFTNKDDTDYVAWNWDMGGTTASNTSGSITSSVRANTAYGQSIVSYVYGAGAKTIGHGLTSAPELILMKNRDYTHNWDVYHKDVGNTKRLKLNDTAAAETYSGVWNDTTPTSSVFSTNNWLTSGHNVIAYCFHDVTGYSKFGSYSGSGSAGKAITTGFAPAFVMTKRTDAVSNWIIWDNTRNPFNPADKHILANSSVAEATTTNPAIDFTSTGFELAGNDSSFNASGGTYIYAAFADTREYAFWYDQSGNNNDWASTDLTESDVMVDSPTNNFATLNPLDKSGTVTLSEGNLKYVNNTGVVRGTIAAGASSKFYLEYCQVSAINSGNPIILGIGTTEGLPAHESAHVQSMVVHCDGNNQKAVRVFVDNSQVQATSFDALTAITTGGILMFAYDGATGKAWVGINGSWLQGNPATGASPIYTFSNTDTRPMTAFVDHAGVTNTGVINFGQDSSFAGAKTPQGNADSGGIGDFYYAPSSGFLALCTSNLPSVDVIPSEHFNTVLYTGNQAANVAVTGVGFQPDLVWGKNRSSASNHWLFDSVRGINKMLQSDQTTAEETQSGVRAFNSFGFTLGTWIGSTKTNDSYVAWNWKAGGSAVSNTNGSITSIVSANPSAGFSIVSYTGNQTSGATVGHGLSQPAEMLILKNRDSASFSWPVYHAKNTSAPATDYLYLNETQATSDQIKFWNDTAPTSTVFSLGDSSTPNANGAAYIAYAFHSVDGYSKVGSFIGNGSETAGPFVYCGFKPKFVLVRRATDVGSWFLFDTERSPYNVMNAKLSAENSGAEESDTSWNIDFLSNGFKLRSPHVYMNSGSNTHVFLAFAESPFKHSNAR